MAVRLAGLARWIAPSWASACVGALAAGELEGLSMHDAFGIAAGAGFVVLAMLPILFALSVAARAVWRGWAPVVRPTVLAHGGAPVLAAWLVFAVIALGALGAAMFGTTQLLVAHTKFRPMLVGYAQPAFGIVAVVVLLVVSRPIVRGLTRVFARRGALFRPVRVVVVLAALIAFGAGAAWATIAPRLGPIDLEPVVTPVVGLGATIATHVVLAWQPRATAWTVRFATVIATAALACAIVAWRARPALTLEVWGELPIAGMVIDRAFDLEAIRDNISLEVFRPVERPDAEHPDIVLIVIDTVRADRTPAYGGPAEMPFFHALAQRGAVFDWALAPSNVTRRSIPSMLTGLAPNRVRGRVVGWALRIDPRHVVLAERLAAGGYDTAGFVCCGGFYGEDSRTGLDRGLAHLVVEKNGTRLAQLARSWVEHRDRVGARKPLFLYMHLLEPHNWAGPGDPPYDAGLRRRLYDRMLTASDKMLADVVSAFGRRPPGRAPIVIVTADHGEALGDHGEPFHSTDLYNSQIRVPFVVAGPGVKAGRISEVASLTDLSPTIIELAGFQPHDADGRSLAPLVTGARASSRDGIAYAAMIKDRSNKGGVSAIVRGQWKLIVAGTRRELYDLARDPNELTDRAAFHPDIVRELEALLVARER